MINAKNTVVALLLAAAAAILAFGPRGDESLPDDRVIVDYWEKWTGSEERQMRQIVDEFNATVGREKKIFVRYVSTNMIDQKTLVAIAAGVPPDIAGVWDGTLVQYAALDALEPLEDLAREFGITSDIYKPAYWEGCSYRGHLYALFSTPGVVALLYNRVMFEQNADVLRAAGLDPYRPPRTLTELDAYAKALDKFDSGRRLTRTGYFPLEPGWYMQYTAYWFGGTVFDETTHKFTLTDPTVVAAYKWVQSYSKKLGADNTYDFRSGFGNFDSPQNPFLAGTIAMEQQGPWMANYIDHLRPEFNRVLWDKETEAGKPLSERKKNYAWAVAAFPSAVDGLEDVTYCTGDIMVIPRGARHKREAFTFMAYLNRQDVMEKLCKLHCKNSPLAEVTDDFINNHPNPYIDVFERLAGSKNARPAPKVPILTEVVDELNNATQRIALLRGEVEPTLAEAQARLQAKYDDFLAKQRARGRM